jgi:hypothetical protein
MYSLTMEGKPINIKERESLRVIIYYEGDFSVADNILTIGGREYNMIEHDTDGDYIVAECTVFSVT